MNFDQLIRLIPPGTAIPKPAAKGNFIVKGVGIRRGEEAIVYFIPNNKSPEKPYEKGITKTEFETALAELNLNGEISRKWFSDTFPRSNKEGPCNFTTLGGFLILLNLAQYCGSGLYKRLG